MKNKKAPKIIVALDYASITEAQVLIDQLDPALCGLKVGKHMFTRFGPQFVRDLVARGFYVFLDLKFHDIPNTVADACLAAAELGVWMINVHVAGGVPMLQAARKVVDELPENGRPLLIGVTVLTSLSDDDLSAVGVKGPVLDTVVNYTNLAKECGLDGVVCSAQEAATLRQSFGDRFLLVTPGIRLSTDKLFDQKRVVTPAYAIAQGADYLVMGRSITQADNPVEVLKMIHETNQFDT